MKMISKFLLLEQPQYLFHLVQYKKIFFHYAQLFYYKSFIYPKKTGLINTCICYKQPQYSGMKLKQFCFACHIDYKHFQADKKQILTKTTRPSIPPIYL